MRLYTAVFSGVAATLAQDLFEVLAPTGVPVEIVAIELVQTSDVGDAAEEILLLTAKRGVGSTTGSGGSTPAMVPVLKGVTAATATVKANNTTVHAAGAGSLTTLAVFAWNIRHPRRIEWPEGCRPQVHPADFFVLGMPAPADSITISGTIWFRELQGTN